MGYGYPAAIGAKVGCPDREVWCVTGDGSFQMNLQELATGVLYDIPVKIAVLNNSSLGMIRQWQKMEALGTLAGGIDYTFPAGTTLAAGAFNHHVPGVAIAAGRHNLCPCADHCATVGRVPRAQGHQPGVIHHRVIIIEAV